MKYVAHKVIKELP